MSKSILIIDTPERCDRCRFHYNTYDTNDCYVDVCIALSPNGTVIDGYTKIYDECPLKELPEKQMRDYTEYDDFLTGYDEGWDDCIDEILGE